MKKSILLLAILALFALPMTAFADDPLPLPAGANADANNHNEEGIAHFKQGHYDVALQHFEGAAKADSSLGEVHYNEALTLDKMGKHAEAKMHFQGAQKNAKGNKAILESATLKAHVK